MQQKKNLHHKAAVAFAEDVAVAVVAAAAMIVAVAEAAAVVAAETKITTLCRQ